MDGFSGDKPGKIVLADIGATFTRLAVGDPDGPLSDMVVTRTPHENRLSIADLVIKYHRKASSKHTIEAISISTIGPLDLRRGWVVNTPNLPLGSFPLREPIERSTGKKVYIMNDCSAIVWGEYIYGDYRATSDMAYITVSTGVGGGIIVDNKLLVGWRGNAHEVGHIVVNYDDTLECGCGGKGHLESLASGARFPLYSKTRAMKYNGPRTMVYRKALEGRLGIQEFFEALKNRDGFASWLYDDYIKALSAGIASVASVFDPKVLLLGGGVILANHERLLGDIKIHINDYLLYSSPPVIDLATYREKAGLMGALAVAVRPPI